MTPFPTFEIQTVKHEVFGGCVTFVMRYRTLGTDNLRRRLQQAFKDIAPDAVYEVLYGRAALLAQAGDIIVSEEAAANHQAYHSLALFWSWRKNVSNDDLIAAAADVWNWFENGLALEFSDEWDAAFGKILVKEYAAPREIQPAEQLTKAELDNPNSSSVGVTKKKASDAS